MIFEWDIPENKGNTDKLLPSAYATKLRNQADNVRTFITAARDDYKMRLGAEDGNAQHTLISGRCRREMK